MSAAAVIIDPKTSSTTLSGKNSKFGIGRMSNSGVNSSSSTSLSTSSTSTSLKSSKNAIIIDDELKNMYVFVFVFSFLHCVVSNSNNRAAIK